MLLIRRAFLVDPAGRYEGVHDLLVQEGKIVKISKREIKRPAARVLEAEGLYLSPGFIDLHAHLRDPGQTYKEDLESGSRSAAAGGFTTLVCMPNTSPPVDDPSVAHYIRLKAQQVGLCRVLPAGAITKGRKGEELTDFYALKRAGCVALTDDGSPLQDASLMRKALELASQLGLTVLNHAEDASLAKGAVHEGRVAALLGLTVRPPEAEELLVARDCVLALRTGGRLHLQHLSTRLSVEIVRFFKKLGAPVTAEVTPHHLFLTEEELLKSGPNAKVNPPLRTEEDRRALIEALKDGTIDCIATDHAPHAPHEKKLLETALPGIIGLQTALPLALELWRQGHLTLREVVALLTLKPARVLNLPYGRLEEGAPADLVLFDPNEEWVLNEETNLSKSRNTPFWGKTLRGRVRYTLLEGRVTYKA